MKIKNLSIVALGALVVVFSACSVTKRHYAPGYHVEWHKNYKGTEQVAQVKQEKATVNLVEEMVAMNEVSAPVVVAEVAAPAEPTSEIALNLDLPPVTGSVSTMASVNQQEMNTSITNKLVVEKKWASVKEKVVKNFQKLSEQSYVAKVHSSKGPDGLSWLIWVAAIIFIPVFGGPIFILVWTAKNNGQPEWKPILLSLLCYLLCWIPGVIYDIIWIKKNCSGSLF